MCGRSSLYSSKGSTLSRRGCKKPSETSGKVDESGRAVETQVPLEDLERNQKILQWMMDGERQRKSSHGWVHFGGETTSNNLNDLKSVWLSGSTQSEICCNTSILLLSPAAAPVAPGGRAPAASLHGQPQWSALAPSTLGSQLSSETTPHQCRTLSLARRLARSSLHTRSSRTQLCPPIQLPTPLPN